MNKTRRVGIWMDHASANVIDISKAEADISNIACDFSHEVKQESLEKSEHLMHQKEQQVQAAYYKRLGAVIVDFEKVLLFGPTNAKMELLNTLISDRAFKEVKIEVKTADKLTIGQQIAFVREHFSE